MKKIIVDIDNTLWDLAPVFFEYLKRYNLEIPVEDLKCGETRLKGYIPREDLYGVLKEIHMRQDQFEPYPEARDFLANLKDSGVFCYYRKHQRREGTRCNREVAQKMRANL